MLAKFRNKLWGMVGYSDQENSTPIELSVKETEQKSVTPKKVGTEATTAPVLNSAQTGHLEVPTPTTPSPKKTCSSSSSVLALSLSPKALTPKEITPKASTPKATTSEPTSGVPPWIVLKPLILPSIIPKGPTPITTTPEPTTPKSPVANTSEAPEVPKTPTYTIGQFCSQKGGENKRTYAAVVQSNTQAPDDGLRDTRRCIR